METNSLTFELDNFQGPLNLLLQLVQKSEVDVCDISLQSLTQQFLELLTTPIASLDSGTEFITYTATLLWLKSKMLLPSEPAPLQGDLFDEDPAFEIIHQLVDYCRLKEAAKDLAKREEQQKHFYTRGSEAEPPTRTKPLGVDHLSLRDLAALFGEVAARAASSGEKNEVLEEPWKVSDKVKALRSELSAHSQISFDEVFTWQMSRAELVVTFLALLELMKLGEACVGRDLSSDTIVIASAQPSEQLS